MTDKRLRSLSKIEMLEMLHSQETEIERLNEEKKELSDRLNALHRELSGFGPFPAVDAGAAIDMGALYGADMSAFPDDPLMMSEIFQVAQDAVDSYLKAQSKRGSGKGI